MTKNYSPVRIDIKIIYCACFIGLAMTISRDLEIKSFLMITFRDHLSHVDLITFSERR